MKAVDIIKKIVGSSIIAMIVLILLFLIEAGTCKIPGCAGVGIVAILPLYGLAILVPIMLVVAIIDRVVTRKSEKQSGKPVTAYQKSGKKDWAITIIILLIALVLVGYLYFSGLLGL